MAKHGFMVCWIRSKAKKKKAPPVNGEADGEKKEASMMVHTRRDDGVMHGNHQWYFQTGAW